MPDYSMDKDIWANDFTGDLFVDTSKWVEDASTKWPQGTELCRYDSVAKKTVAWYFASQSGKWIKFGNS